MNKKENTKISDINLKKVRIKVFNETVKVHNGKIPDEYQKLFNRYEFDDHRTFLKINNKVIGFIVSPYNLHTERHMALQMEGHKVIEMRQYYNLKCETLAVIKEEYVSQCILWRVYDLK